MAFKRSPLELLDYGAVGGSFSPLYLPKRETPWHWRLHTCQAPVYPVRKKAPSLREEVEKRYEIVLEGFKAPSKLPKGGHIQVVLRETPPPRPRRPAPEFSMVPEMSGSQSQKSLSLVDLQRYGNPFFHDTTLPQRYHLTDEPLLPARASSSSIFPILSSASPYSLQSPAFRYF